MNQAIAREPLHLLGGLQNPDKTLHISNSLVDPKTPWANKVGGRAQWRARLTEGPVDSASGSRWCRRRFCNGLHILLLSRWAAGSPSDKFVPKSLFWASWNPTGLPHLSLLHSQGDHAIRSRNVLIESAPVVGPRGTDGDRVALNDTDGDLHDGDFVGTETTSQNNVSRQETIS